MKRIVTLLLVAAMLLSMMISVTAAGNVVFVSPNGSDSANGSQSAPVATLSKACELAGVGGTVNVMEGTYKVNSSAKALSGMTIQSYNGAKVVFNASNKIDASKFKKLTDTAVLDRIIEKKAKENVVAVKLSDVGINEYGQINMSGFGYATAAMPPQLLVNNETFTLARYPDDDYMMVDEVLNAGVDVRGSEDRDVLHYLGKGIKIRTNDARTDKWKKAKDIWIFGYFMHDWAEANLSATLDPNNKGVIATKYPSVYGVTTERRFYAYNLLEEISKTGEWYLDRETGILYLYPKKALSAKDSVEFITFNQPFITIENSDNVTIKGIEFAKGLDMGVKVSGGKNVKISDCTFSDISSTAIEMINTVDGIIEYCNFKNLGFRGVTIESGENKTLTSGNCKVTNCKFDGFSKVQPTNAPAVWLRGVGHTVSHNEMRDGTSNAIWFGGSKHIIEYNDISEVCTDTADAGAIYAGRHWANRGNEIRYNYIHDMDIISTNTGMKVQAIYLDDMFSSAKVYGNIIKNVPSVALYGGGRYNTFENNIVLECEEPFVFDARGTDWMDCGEGSEIMTYLKNVPYDTGIWKKEFPELAGILDDDPELPKYNVIKNNVSYRTPDFDLVNYVKQYGTVENNIEISSTKDFENYAKGDLNLKADAEIFKKLPDFKAIDFDAIGIQERKAEPVKPEVTDDSVLNSSVILKINNPKTYVFGKESKVDKNNNAVAPKIINNRTLVPVRFIAESFGGEVGWDDKTKKVTVKYGESVIELYINKAEITVNGKTSALDVPAQILESRTMLPLRAVVEALGMEVFWDSRGLIVISKEPVLTEKDTAKVTEIIKKFN